MTNYIIAAALFTFAAFVAGFLVGAMRVHNKFRKSWQAAAFLIPFQKPICKRCGVELRTRGVMFVDKYPGPGQLYCHACFQKLTPAGLWQIVTK